MISCFSCGRTPDALSGVGFSMIHKGTNDPNDLVLLVCDECSKKIPLDSRGSLISNRLIVGMDSLIAAGHAQRISREAILKTFPNAQEALSMARL